MIPVAEQIEFQTLTFYHFLARHITDVDGGKVGLAGNGTETGELGAIKFHPIVVVWMLVGKTFQYARIVIGRVVGLFA